VQNSSKEDLDVMRDLKEFVRFFQSLWGLLAGGSLFFPFINLFVDAIPYPAEAVHSVSAAVAMLGSAFAFLLVYMTRQLIPRLDDENLGFSIGTSRRRLPLAGYRSVFVSSIVFVFFIVVLADYLPIAWLGSFDVSNIDKSRLVTGVLEYALVFTLATLTFSVLATSEYMRQLARRQEREQEVWPSSETALNAIYLRLPQSDRKRFDQLRVLHEARSKQDGKPMLELTARWDYSGDEYKAKVDRDGNVLEFNQIGKSQKYGN
jgi:hypothetical protein